MVDRSDITAAGAVAGAGLLVVLLVAATVVGILAMIALSFAIPIVGFSWWQGNASLRLVVGLLVLYVSVSIVLDALKLATDVVRGVME